MPTLVNRHHYAWAPGFGPKPKRQSASAKPLPLRSIYIGRGTPLGNPFTIAEHGEAALPRFRDYLRGKLRARDPEILRALGAIGPEDHLVCSCAPRPCHGEVVLLAWQWCRDKGLI